MYQSKQQNASAQVTVGYGFSASGNYSQSKINASHQSISEQSGIYAGDDGYQINIAQHTDLKGGIITSTQSAEDTGKNRFSTGTLTFSDIQNHSRYEGESFGLGGGMEINGGWNGKTVDQNGNPTSSAHSSVGYGNDSDSQESTTRSGINTRNISITDEAEQIRLTGKTVEEAKAQIHTDTTTDTAQELSGSLKNVFDKDRVQNELDLQRTVSQSFNQNVQAANSEINKYLDNLKAKLDKGEISQSDYDAQVENWQHGKVLLNMISAGLSTPTQSGAGIAAATASPALSYGIGQYFKGLAQENQHSGKTQEAELTTGQQTAHILAHAVLGAATAAAGNNNALSGALAAGGAEAAAPVISGWLYGEKDGSKLTAEQKETVSSISNLLGAATGAVVGNSVTDAVQGSLNAQGAVENNGILDRDGLLPDERNKKLLIERYGLDVNKIANMLKNGELILNKEIADYIYTINKNPNLIITIPDNGEPLSVVLLNTENGWRKNPAKPDEEIHDARVSYTSFGQWSVFGKVLVSRNKVTGKLRIIPDRYDFEMQKGISKIPRNVETFLGSPGLGTSFKIEFKGEIKIE